MVIVLNNSVLFEELVWENQQKKLHLKKLKEIKHGKMLNSKWGNSG